MSVIGEAEVRRAATAGRREIVVRPHDVLTPQARDAAGELGLEIVDHPRQPAAAPVVDEATAVRRVLLRRSPRWMPSEPRLPAAARILDRVAIVGAGMVGTTTAHVLALAGAARELVLVDVAPGLAAAVALDLEHSVGITVSPTVTRGGTEMSLLADADVVIITAGRPRQPGMDRRDLADVNGKIVRSVAEAVAEHAPNSVIIVVTNPLDEMAREAYLATGFCRRRVLGMAGTLDSSRFRSALARAADVDPKDVEAITLGSHGNEMVPVISRATIRGRPVTEVLSPETIAHCVEATVHAGGRVVELRRTGSAFLAPGHAIAEVVDAMRGAVRGPNPVSVLLNGEYGLSDIFLGVPALLDDRGLVEVVEVPLAPDEKRALFAAAEAVRGRMSLRTG